MSERKLGSSPYFTSEKLQTQLELQTSVENFLEAATLIVLKELQTLIEKGNLIDETILNQIIFKSFKQVKVDWIYFSALTKIRNFEEYLDEFSLRFSWLKDKNNKVSIYFWGGCDYKEERLADLESLKDKIIKIIFNKVKEQLKKRFLQIELEKALKTMKDFLNPENPNLFLVNFALNSCTRVPHLSLDKNYAFLFGEDVYSEERQKFDSLLKKQLLDIVKFWPEYRYAQYQLLLDKGKEFFLELEKRKNKENAEEESNTKIHSLKKELEVLFNRTFNEMGHFMLGNQRYDSKRFFQDLKKLLQA
jgi:hypothetical protein